MFYVPALPPNAQYSAASTTQHKIGHFCLSSITDGRRINALKIEDHRVILLTSDTVCNSTWEGQRIPPQPYAAGEMAFLPANTELSSVATVAYGAASVRLADSWLRETVLGDFDYSQIDFRFGKLRAGPAAHIVSTIVSLTDTPGFHWPALIEGLTVSLAASVVVGLSTGDRQVLKAKNGLTRERKQRVLAYIEDNFLDHKVQLKDLAAIAALSVYHFSRSFRATMGISPVRYVAERRVRHAKHMMRTTSSPMVAVSYASGYSSQSHFNTAFRATAGVSPGVWRLGSA